MIDPVNMVFYAAVCGILAAVAPQDKSRLIRALFGGFVGIFASSVLPYLKVLLGIVAG